MCGSSVEQIGTLLCLRSRSGLVAGLALNTLQPAPLFSISLLKLREFELWQIRKWIKVVQTLDFLGVKKILSKQIFQ